MAIPGVSTYHPGTGEKKRQRSENHMSTHRQDNIYLPMLDWIREYPKEWLRLDVIAGLTTAAVVIPKAMANATIAGLPVQVGLYTAFLPMLIYAVFGTSRPLSAVSYTHLRAHETDSYLVCRLLL